MNTIIFPDTRRYVRSSPSLLETARSKAVEDGPEDRKIRDLDGCYRCLGPDRWSVITVHGEDDWQEVVHGSGLGRASG